MITPSTRVEVHRIKHTVQKNENSCIVCAAVFEATKEMDMPNPFVAF